MLNYLKFPAPQSNTKLNLQISFQCKHGYYALIGGAVERPNLQISSRLGKAENLSRA